MIHLFQDHFDSSILSRKVYKLQIDGGINDEIELNSKIFKTDIDLLCAFVQFSHTNIRFFENLKASLVSIRSYYERNLFLEPNTLDLPSGYKLFYSHDKITKFSTVDLDNLVLSIGATSRYFKDPGIPREKSLDLYKTWILNSLRNGYADEFIILMHEDTLVGLHTMKIKEGIGYIDLIGIQTKEQSKGLGKILCLAGLNRLMVMGVKAFRVITEAENVPACAFYQKIGFTGYKTELVYHKHF